MFVLFQELRCVDPVTRDLTKLLRNGKENVKKAIGLMSKTTTTLHMHHAFLYISLLSLHNYNVK